jgi:hypothetical protein
MTRDFLNKNEFLFLGDRKISLDTPPIFRISYRHGPKKRRGVLKFSLPHEKPNYLFYFNLIK